MNAVGDRIREIVMHPELWGDDTDAEILAIGLMLDDATFTRMQFEAELISTGRKKFEAWRDSYSNREAIRRTTAGIKNLTKVRVHP
jgi:hypothetical protein